MKTKDIPSSVVLQRPPIVAVLGHVDHGKTSLLDFIRSTHVTAKEHGGITQHIGAYQVSVASGKGKESKSEERLITFIDTPGHEAFIKMRSRGATVADIAVLVVAADDSVKPQTVESIRVILAAKVPIIVALNKMDLPTANPEKVKKDLAKAGVQVEGFGGDVPIVPISAKTGTGIPDLLEMILLLSDMKEKPQVADSTPRGVVIETRVDKGKGLVASVIVTGGTFDAGEFLFEGSKQIAKIRAMFDDHGVVVKQATAGKPIEVLGFTVMPSVGAVLFTKPSIGALATLVPDKKNTLASLPDFLQPINPDERKSLTILLKADTAGSIEAVMESLGERIKVISGGIGDITEADILQAKATGAVVIGFHSKAGSSVIKLAQTEKVVYRTYTIIYELLDELAEVVEGLKNTSLGERELGNGAIIAEFPYENMRIAGTKVASGRLVRGDLVRVMRGDKEIGRGKIKSLRVGKDDAGKVQGGSECGVLFDREVDFAVGDGIIAYTTG